MPYYFHPESDSLWYQEKSEDNHDGHVLEYSQKQAEQLSMSSGIEIYYTDCCGAYSSEAGCCVGGNDKTVTINMEVDESW